VQYLFARWDKFQHPPFHPKWRDINLAATVPGWTRFSIAEDLLQKTQARQTQQADFQNFLSNRSGVPASESEREALFRDFLQWQGKQGGR